MEESALHELVKKLTDEVTQLKAENMELRTLLSKAKGEDATKAVQTRIKMGSSTEGKPIAVTMNSTKEEKIELYRSLFRGRDDVCAKRWKNKPGYSPYCFHDFREGICHKPKVKCSDCKNSRFAPLDEERIEGHLLGKYVLGLYPMLKNDACRLLVMDFDEATWQKDVQAVRIVCSRNKVPAYFERSRSGNGCHVWFFFQEEVKAGIARRFGLFLLSLAMKECGSIKFSSYDRLFPSQDMLQSDGFGNLIALPLQKEARELGNSVFVNERFEEIEDQWALLSRIERISTEDLESLSSMFCTLEEPSGAPRSRRNDTLSDLKREDFPATVWLERGRGLALSKKDLSPRALLFLRELASYPNPEFFAKQAMRQTTFGIPRMSEIYEEEEEVIVLPRGKENAVFDALHQMEVPYQLRESRNPGAPYPMHFCGQLTKQQEEAFLALNAKEEGVLSATTGFGKTVIGAKLIAEKSVATLVLVHTKELAHQWKERLEQFLEIDASIAPIPRKGKKDPSVIGFLGGGKNTLNGIVDIAIMQSLFEKDKSVKAFIHSYGLILVDECHHVSAKNFSRILSAQDAKNVYGLTATPIRKDGHHPIIFMHCGPIRYKVDAKKEARKRTFDHFILPRFTSVRMPVHKEPKGWHITEVYKYICESEVRNQRIADDVFDAVENGRNPLVLTERVSHVLALEKMLKEKKLNLIVLTGGLKSKERKDAVSRIKDLKDGEKFAILATGKLVGEGFDVPRLDTLFLAMPIAWKGTITQYSGRLHRRFDEKKEVQIYDYVDVHIPVLERMYHKRLSAYKGLGYSLRSPEEQGMNSGIFDAQNYFEPLVEDILNAKTSILLSTAFITRRKLHAIKEPLVEKYQSGVHITIYVKAMEEYPERHRGRMIEILRELQGQGVQVIQRAGNHLKFMMVDNSVVWYGGMDLLSSSHADDTIIRVRDEALAHEMIGVLLNEGLKARSVSERDSLMR